MNHIEQKLQSALRKKLADFLVPYVWKHLESTIKSNTGKFIIKTIDKIKVKGDFCDKGQLTADLVVLVAPNYTGDRKMHLEFTKANNKYHGRID